MKRLKYLILVVGLVLMHGVYAQQAPDGLKLSQLPEREKQAPGGVELEELLIKLEQLEYVVRSQSEAIFFLDGKIKDQEERILLLETENQNVGE